MEKRAAVTTIMKPNTRTEEADLDVSSTARSLSVLSPSWSGAAKLQQTAQQVSRRTVRITQWETATEDFSCTLCRTFICHLSSTCYFRADFYLFWKKNYCICKKTFSCKYVFIVASSDLYRKHIKIY